MEKANANPFLRLADRIESFYAWRDDKEKELWCRALNLFVNLALALISVIPLMWRIYRQVPFTYEVNDDSALVQILDGSFTGKPDPHSIFVRYPLSWIISRLYQLNPKLHIRGTVLENVNWYVTVFAVLTAFALTAVLFRILNYYKSNRLLFCLLFDMAFLLGWLPCFSNMTFSTAAAFMGCMGILFFAFESPDEAWRPWNIAVLAVLLISSWSFRKPCCYMVLPVIGLELILKYNIRFFKSWKPWMLCVVAGLLAFFTVRLDSSMYGSQAWKRYLIYNHSRAYLQDYAGFPAYQENIDFYQSMGMDECMRDAMANYTYGIVDGFSTDWVEKTYMYVKEQEPDDSLYERAQAAVPTAKQYLEKTSDVNSSLINAARYCWLLLAVLFPVSLVFCWQKGILSHLQQLLSILGTAVIVWLEWVYLAMNGRFPLRVKEAVWLLTFSAGFSLAAKLIGQWRGRTFTRIPLLIQICLLVMFLRTDPISPIIHTRALVQRQELSAGSEKAEVAAYCGRHPESYYVIDTRSVTKGTSPQDDLHQGNWFLTGSWMTYSPVYTQKLKEAKTGSLGSAFLLRENVYLITQGKKGIARLMGIADNNRVQADIVDEFMTSNNLFFEVYKIRSVK